MKPTPFDVYIYVGGASDGVYGCPSSMGEV